MEAVRELALDEDMLQIKEEAVFLSLVAEFKENATAFLGDGPHEVLHGAENAEG